MCLGLYWVWLYLQTPVCHDIWNKVLHQSPSLHCPRPSINQMVINSDSPQQSWSNPNIDVFYIPSILSHPLWKLKLICVLFFPNIIACHRPEPLILYLFPEMMLDLLNISNIFSSILGFQHIFIFLIFIQYHLILEKSGVDYVCICQCILALGIICFFSAREDQQHSLLQLKSIIVLLAPIKPEINKSTSQANVSGA